MKKSFVILTIMLLALSSVVFAGRGLDCDLDDCTDLVGLWRFDDSSLGSEVSSSATGLDSLWHVDESTGIIYDATLANNDFSQSNGVGYSEPAVFGTGLLFHGDNDYLTTSTNDFSYGTNDAFSVSFWMRSDDVISNPSRILRHHDDRGYAVFMYSGNVGGVVANSTNTWKTVHGGFVADDKWHYVVFTYDSGDERIYVDGSLKDNATYLMNYPPTSSTFRFGTTSGVSEFYNGKLDEFSMWSRALSSSEVSAFYDRGRASDSYSSNDGQLVGPSSAIGKFGNALDLDGSNDYVDMGSSVLSGDTDGFAVSAWFYIDSVGGVHRTIVSKDYRLSGSEERMFQLQLLDSGSLAGYVWDNSVGAYLGKSSAILSTGQWYHAVFVYDGGSTQDDVHLYVNGVLDDAVNFSGGSFSGIDDTSADFLVGAYSDGAGSKGRFFDGKIEDVAIWSDPLNASEVLAVYNLGVGGLSSDTEFNTSFGTTDFSSVSNISSVPSMTLAKSVGKVVWSNNVNAKDQDFDTYVKIEAGFVSVDSTNLDSSLNSSATITLEDVGCSLCDADGVYYSASETTKAGVQSNGVSCGTAGVCSGFSCSNNDCTFTVSGFSGYAYGGNANLTINDSAEGSYVENDTSATFYAYYINATDGSAISGATCTVDFDDGSGSQSMSFSTDHYEYVKSAGFSSAATHDWNVTCSKSGFSSLFAEDTISVQAPATPGAAVPEFSVWTLLIGMLVIIGGFLAIRRQD